jgi:peptidoglycan hydrolase-like protein with peptidoglycan-binding domain
MNGLYLYPEVEKACPSILRRGSRGPEVRKLQSLLNNWITRFPGPGKTSKLTVNGIFDGRTETAVRAFENISNLESKGVVGLETCRALLRWN